MANAARSAADQAGFPGTGTAAESGPPELLEKLQSVTPAERLELTVSSLRQQAARVLAMDDAHLPDPRRTLNELGFDSLTGVEFCNRVSRSIGQRLNPAVLFDYPTLESLAGHVLRDVLGLGAPGGNALVGAGPAAEIADPATRQTAKVLDDVELMSEEEMNTLVTAQLGRLQE